MDIGFWWILSVHAKVTLHAVWKCMDIIIDCHIFLLHVLVEVLVLFCRLRMCARSCPLNSIEPQVSILQLLNHFEAKVNPLMTGWSLSLADPHCLFQKMCALAMHLCTEATACWSPKNITSQHFDDSDTKSWEHSMTWLCYAVLLFGVERDNVALTHHIYTVHNTYSDLMWFSYTVVVI